MAASLVVIRLDPDQLHLPPQLEGYDAHGILAYSRICTHAGCAITLYRAPLFQPDEPKPALVCPCHYSTFDPATGGTVTFGPAGRDLPLLPVYVDSQRLPAREGQLRRAGRPVVVGRPHLEGAAVTVRGAPLTRRTVRWLDQRTATRAVPAQGAPLPLPRPLVVPARRGRALRFIVLVATGIYLTFFFVDSTREVVYHGPYAPLYGQKMSEAYASVVHLSLAVARRPADPADAPLGGERLHRGDRAPPLPRLLHGRATASRAS